MWTLRAYHENNTWFPYLASWRSAVIYRDFRHHHLQRAFQLSRMPTCPAPKEDTWKIERMKRCCFPPAPCSQKHKSRFSQGVGRLKVVGIFRLFTYVALVWVECNTQNITQSEKENLTKVEPGIDNQYNNFLNLTQCVESPQGVRCLLHNLCKLY